MANSPQLTPPLPHPPPDDPDYRTLIVKMCNFRDLFSLFFHKDDAAAICKQVRASGVSPLTGGTRYKEVVQDVVLEYLEGDTFDDLKQRWRVAMSKADKDALSYAAIVENWREIRDGEDAPTTSSTSGAASPPAASSPLTFPGSSPFPVGVSPRSGSHDDDDSDLLPAGHWGVEDEDGAQPGAGRENELDDDDQPKEDELDDVQVWNTQAEKAAQFEEEINFLGLAPSEPSRSFTREGTPAFDNFFHDYEDSASSRTNPVQLGALWPAKQLLASSASIVVPSPSPIRHSGGQPQTRGGPVGLEYSSSPPMATSKLPSPQMSPAPPAPASSGHSASASTSPRQAPDGLHPQRRVASPSTIPTASSRSTALPSTIRPVAHPSQPVSTSSRTPTPAVETSLSPAAAPVPPMPADPADISPITVATPGGGEPSPSIALAPPSRPDSLSEPALTLHPQPSTPSLTANLSHGPPPPTHLSDLILASFPADLKNPTDPKVKYFLTTE